MWHELVCCSEERVVVLLSGKSVIAVGARCTDVRANELLVRGRCTVAWYSARCYLYGTRYVTCVGTCG